MPDPRFEVGLTLPFDLTDWTAAATLVEAAGYDYLAIGEHVSFHGPTANAFVVLAHAAAVTSRVRLLSAVTLAPLYPAALLAKLAATTDIVSGGRFELGIGVGGEYPPEFEAVGVPTAERGARADETLRVVRALWSGRPASHRGRFWRFDDIALRPAPPTQPGPRIWIAGRGEAAIRRAVRSGDVWMPYMYTPTNSPAARRRSGPAWNAPGALPTRSCPASTASSPSTTTRIGPGRPPRPGSARRTGRTSPVTAGAT
ncbi:LLM class flavin-dependent oxidoreductase [Plantactinospora sp. KBS50]|uniref:LLM class flavin-dependent oxidoreductase n=1 Tax=Plantactinospora sp. KBS50 TaxID=2024580 RepID=UPI000BAB1918|nr:LLM class flavin-dependent oxidoreductase [Plantactinospora sp. KBS50]ASW55634.1 hypothetical protein CIK06_17785 [Plantactinospora sp. KBS50]